jgi:hypothetical protein
MTDLVRRTGKLFASGNYEDKHYSMTDEELAAAAAAFSPVPIDIEHVPSVLSGKLGMLESINIDADGKTLLGTVAMPSWLDALIDDSERKVSCTWDRATKRLTGLALVRNPRIEDAVLMAAFGAADTVSIPADFAGKRHSAADTADMQTIHDIAAKQGAVCPDMNEGDDTMPDTMTPEQQMGLFGKFMAWMGAGEHPVTTPATFNAPTQASPAAPQPDPEKDSLKAQLAQLRAQQIGDRAAAFAAEQITANKALPAQRDAIIAAYSVLAADDAEYGQATFGSAKTTRVDALAALFTNAPTHGLTTQAMPVGAQELANQLTTPGANFGQDQPDRKETLRLLTLTPEGRAALKDMANGK